MFVTPLYAGLLAVWFLVLSIKVVQGRGHGPSLGDGGDPHMLRLMRGHANFAEYVPLALLHVPAALLVALIPACCLVPMLDRRFGGQEQTWQLLSARTSATPRRRSVPRPLAVSRRQTQVASGALLLALTAGVVPTRSFQTTLLKATFPPSPMMTRLAAPVRPVVEALAPTTVHAATTISTDASRLNVLLSAIWT